MEGSKSLYGTNEVVDIIKKIRPIHIVEVAPRVGSPLTVSAVSAFGFLLMLCSLIVPWIKISLGLMSKSLYLWEIGEGFKGIEGAPALIGFIYPFIVVAFIGGLIGISTSSLKEKSLRAVVNLAALALSSFSLYFFSALGAELCIRLQH
jgi:hypothetical protein